MDSGGEITVLVVDIRNFTYHSSRADQRIRTDEDYARKLEIVCGIITSFHNLTFDTIRRFDPDLQGRVISTGDGVIAIFRGGDNAGRAVKCAVDLQVRYEPFFREANASIQEQRRSTALDFGIGLHGGMVKVESYGDYQDPRLQRPLFLGDPVNIATRIESLTKDHPECRILLSETVHRQVDPSVFGGGIVDYHIHSIRGFGALHLYGIPRFSN
jgi:class 3 adenylate cyclase